MDCFSRNGHEHEQFSVSKIVDDIKFIEAQQAEEFMKYAWRKYDFITEAKEMKQHKIEVSFAKWETTVVKKDRKMYHRLVNNQLGNKYNRLCVPKKYQLELMREVHERHHYNHKICHNMMNKVVFWPGMFTDMKNYCQSCIKCQEGNPYTQKTVGPLKQFPKMRRFQMVQIDLWSGVPQSSKLGNTAVVVMTDHAT